MERKMMKIALAVMSVLIALMLVHVAHAEEIIAEIHTQDEAVEIQEGPPINRISEALDQADIEQYYYYDMSRITDPEKQLEGVAVEKGWVYDDTLPWSKEEQIKQFLGLRPKCEYLGEFKISFYCSCRRCNGHWGAIDGFGKPLEWGCVAVDPAVIPMHTRLIIDGYDMVFEARDTGSGVDGRHIDMYVPVSHAEALAMPNGTKVKVWRYE